MTKMTPLLERNEQFARTYTPAALGLPAAQVVVVACLDHRADPAIVDVERLLTAPSLSPKVSVSGHVYDIATGRVTTTVDARYPSSPVND
jgi:carbonic anhydrase